MTLIRQQIRVLRAIGLQPQSSATLAANPPEGMDGTDVYAAIAVLAAARRIIYHIGEWHLRGTVGRERTPTMLAAIEATCRIAELAEDVHEKIQQNGRQP